MLDRLSNIASLEGFHDLESLIFSLRGNLDEPLKLSIIGETSAGKSTIVNSFLKSYLVPTGVLTTTYNVNVIRHISKSPSGKEILVIHFKDNSTKQLEIDALSKLVDGTTNDELGYRNNIKWVDVYRDLDFLKNVDVMDTPGLFSTKINDSTNTIDLFQDESRQPDVILFVSQKVYKGDELEVIDAFQKEAKTGNFKMDGLNTITAFTHCDRFCENNWEKGYHQKAFEIINETRNDFALFRKCFSRAFAVAPLFAQSAFSLTESDFLSLKMVAKSDFSEKFCSKFYTKRRYFDHSKDAEYWESIFTSITEKEQVFNRLELEVMQYCVWWIKNNKEGNSEELKKSLIQFSGIQELNSYIFEEHFLKLSGFYKSINIIPKLRKLVDKRLSKAFDSVEKQRLKECLELIKITENKVYSQYSYLNILRDYYNNEQYFDKEEWDVAMQSVQLCMHNVHNPEVENNIKYWEDKLFYYNRIYQISSEDACKLLIKSLKGIL